MGFRLEAESNFMPAYVKQNILYCDYLCPGKGIKVKADGIDFPEQYTQIRNDRVTAYLQNGDYELVLRFDGTGCLVQRGYLRRSFTYEVLEKTWAAGYKGMLRDDLGNLFPARYIIVGNAAAVSVYQIPVVLWIKDYKKSAFFKDMESVLPAIYVNNVKGKICYKDQPDFVVEGKQLWSRGFKVLGGYNIGKMGMFIEGKQ